MCFALNFSLVVVVSKVNLFQNRHKIKSESLCRERVRKRVRERRETEKSKEKEKREKFKAEN